MKRKFRVFYSLIIIISLISTTLIGCTKPAETTPQTEEKKPEAQQVEQKTEAKPVTNLDPFSEEYDKTLEDNAIAAATTPDEFKNTKTYEYLVNWGTAPNTDTSYGQRYFEKKFNVKLKAVRLESGNTQEQRNVMFASGVRPDVMAVSLREVSTYARQGLLAEVKEDTIKANMPDYYALIQKFDPTLLKITKVDGKNMGLARFYPNGGVPRGAAIRADWLKNVGINQVPKTLDELGEAFLRFRNNDPDKNGKKDTYALTNPSDYAGEYWFQSIFGAFGTNPFIWADVNGKLQFGFTTDEVKQGLKLLNKWYKQELIDPEFITEVGRKVEAEDIAAKFSKGKIGYMDNLTFDDHEWDNDGHLNAKWVPNNKAWMDFFNQNKADPDKLYSTKLITDFNDSLPQPYYISLPPVKGPNGKSGYHRQGYQETIFVFGKQLENDSEKLNKILKIFNYLNKDEESHLMLSYGPENLQWIKDSKGRRLLNPDWSKHKHFDPGFRIQGSSWTMNPMNWTNPDFLTFIGGPRAEQRYTYTGDIMRQFSYYENKLKVTLPSQAEYTELIDTRIKEYVIKAITGDIDIDKTYDAAVQSWYKDGGDKLTKEANDWYSSNK